jgi:hypothetical protein
MWQEASVKQRVKARVAHNTKQYMPSGPTGREEATEATVPSTFTKNVFTFMVCRRKERGKEANEAMLNHLQSPTTKQRMA